MEVYLCSALTQEKEEGKALLPLLKITRPGLPAWLKVTPPSPTAADMSQMTLFGTFFSWFRGSKEPGGRQDAHCPAWLQAVEFIFHPSDTSRVPLLNVRA